MSSSNLNAFNVYGDSQRVYIGKVIGLSATQYAKHDLSYLEKKYALERITKSPYLIEIRLYNNTPICQDRCFTRLYYDSSFKMEGYVPTGKGSKKEDIQINADSIYDKLIENAVFSLVPFDGKTCRADTALYLKGNALGRSTYYCGGFDGGTWYTLEFKVGDTYSLLYLDNPAFRLQTNPDHQLFRRHHGIVSALMTKAK